MTLIKENAVARVLKDYDQRKNEFLDAAQELFYSVGYEQTSVNMILEKVGVAKGTFYHYFKSKIDLLDALVIRLTDSIMDRIEAVVDDPSLDAITKMNKVFEVSGSYKTDHKELIFTLARTLYRDENILLRKKMNDRSVELMRPQMSRIIRQGLDEGVFNTEFPDDASDMIFSLATNMGDKNSLLLLTLEDHPENIELLMKNFDMYQDAIERFIGAPSGSIRFKAREVLEKLLK